MKSSGENDPTYENSSGKKIPRVSIVDDDESVREAIRSLLRSVGLTVDAFGSAEEFLKSDSLKEAACLILDVRMPGMGGLELQRWLATANFHIPIIFISAHASDTEARNRALKAGAIDFLFKPFNEETLLTDVNAVLEYWGRRSSA